MQVEIKGNVAPMPFKNLQNKKHNREFNNRLHEQPKRKIGNFGLFRRCQRIVIVFSLKATFRTISPWKSTNITSISGFILKISVQFEWLAIWLEYLPNWYLKLILRKMEDTSNFLTMLVFMTKKRSENYDHFPQTSPE